MDSHRRESMPMSGSPYYMQRGMPELHGQQGIRELSSSNMAFQPNVGGIPPGSGMVGEPSVQAEASIGGRSAAGQPSGVPVRRKRGRPRKYGPDGAASLALSSSPAAGGRGLGTTSAAAATGAASPPAKRGRGRPPGSGRKQRQVSDSVGNWMPSLTGAGFTPHVITIAAGEDIGGKITSFARQGQRAVCVMAVSGTVSSVTLRQASSSGTITYEGRFDILHMSGALVVTGNADDSSHAQSGSLSISLVSPDGRVIGGGVGGMLIAASPVQVILGSFVGGGSKTKQKTARREGGVGVVGDETDNRLPDMTPASIQRQSQTPTSNPMGGAWPSSQAVEMHNSHFDIDLMRG